MIAEKSGFRFDPSVNLGHILTFIGFLLTGFMAFQHLDKRVAILEENKRTQAMVDAYQDQRGHEQGLAIQQSLTEIKKSIEKVDNKIEKIRN
jgi:hypothetical protein